MPRSAAVVEGTVVAEPPTMTVVRDEEPRSRRKDGIVIRTVSGSIRLIGGSSVVVGGAALGSLGHLGIPHRVADTMVGAQARTMRTVSGGADKVTTSTLRGIGRAGRTLGGGTLGALTGAAGGGFRGARKAWRNG